MSDDLRDALTRPRYPRSNAYDPAWIVSLDQGINALWLAEALCEVMPFEAGMRVLDLGCGKAAGSIFLAREFGVTVWAVDLLVGPTANWRRVREAGLEDLIVPLRADARSLPFAPDFFDAVVSFNAFSCFGTDGYYLRELVPFLRAGGRLGVVHGGLRDEIPTAPRHFARLWKEQFDVLHSPRWWRRHWERTRLVDVETADLVPDGWEDWLRWRELVKSRGAGVERLVNADLETLRADGGDALAVVRVVARKRG
jgi:SAM-dependent methyltransferase